MAESQQTQAQHGMTLDEAGIFRLTRPGSAAEQHIHHLASAVDADIFIHTRDFDVWSCSASPAKPQFAQRAKLHLAPLELPFSELIALHELGHLHLHHASAATHGAPEEFRCEGQAWLWALDHLRLPLDSTEQDLVATIMARRAWCSIVFDGHPALPAADPIWRLISAGKIKPELIEECGQGFLEDLDEHGLAAGELDPAALIGWLGAHAAGSAATVG